MTEAGSAGDATAGGAAGLRNQPIPDEYWQPMGDPGWTPVGWAPDCALEVAGKPELALPELKWASCEGTAGCRLVVPSWYAKNQIYLGFASGYRDGATSRLGIATGWGDDSEWRSAVYDENWRPLVAWRGARAGCNGVSPRPAPAHICFISSNVEGPAVAGLLSATQPSAKPLRTFSTSAILNQDCSDDVEVNYDGSGKLWFYDVAAGKQQGLTLPSGQPMVAAVHGDAAYFSRWYSAGGEAMDGWVWTPQGGAKMLVSVPQKFIADLRSDGSSLAWLQLDMTSLSHAAAGELWTSPQTLENASLQPKLLRAVPSSQASAPFKAIGGGFYALVEQHDDQSLRKLHLYRLSDGRHWELPPPAGLLPSAIVWLTDQELLYRATLPSGAAHTLVRQDLTALGAGD
jgi:hypothetical protein